MSYLNRTLDPRRRNGAIIAVIAIHAAVGYGLVDKVLTNRTEAIV